MFPNSFYFGLNITLLAKKKAPLSKGELIKWFGIRLVMAVEPRRGPLRTYWKSESDAGVVSTAANYEGCFGMKLSRFTDTNHGAVHKNDTKGSYSGEVLFRQLMCMIIRDKAHLQLKESG